VSWFSRLLQRLRGEARPPLPEEGGEPPGPDAGEAGDQPAAPLPAPLVAFDQLLHRLRTGQGEGLTPEAAEAEGMNLAAALAERGLEHEAAARLERLLELHPRRHALIFQLARLNLALGHEARAAPLLQRYLDLPGALPHRVDAHLALGEDLERRTGGPEGDRLALAHYEAVLAHDFDHPRARPRADQLRRKVDRGRQPQAAPTLRGAQQEGEATRYLIQRELGRGGGGAVYLALDQTLKRKVALKVLHPHVSRQAGTREHMFCEARIASALAHPRIVTIHDLDEQLNMVVMEYCAGGTLADLLPLAARPALKTVARVARILDLVHRCGVVHRDLKPRNLLLRRQGEPGSLVLTDFGLANAADDEAGQDAAGSLIYMAPEQRAGQPCGPAADLYACGVLLLEMLLGRPPLDKNQALQGVSLLDLEQPWQEAAGTQWLPPGALALCRHLVGRRPEDRPASAAAVARQADALAAEVAAAARRAAVVTRLRAEHPDPANPELRAWLGDPWSTS